MARKIPVAVFDIDGTVFRSSLILELIDHLVEKEILPQAVRRAYQRERTRWLDRRGEYEAYIDAAVRAFNAHIKGVSFTDIEQAAEELLIAKRKRVYRYTRHLIKQLKQKGYFLLAISHSPRFVTDIFGYEFGFDKIYGFFYESDKKGKMTGKVTDLALIRKKDAVLKRAIEKEGLTLKGSIGVGDTESDIPMLNLVERPIAFNPNKKLYEHAKKKGWEIIVERKDVIYTL